MAMGAPLRFISATQLLGLRGSPGVAIIDVRGEDERSYDGHIAGSLHYESSSFRDNLPQLLRELSGHKTVVFHCALSQVRGPTCAKAFLHSLSSTPGSVPEVFVLEKGFNGWAAYGHPLCSCKGVKCISLTKGAGGSQLQQLVQQTEAQSQQAGTTTDTLNTE